MLVLSRHPGERIYIGPNQEIEIVILNIVGESIVRVGITADKSIPILREEVWLRDRLPENPLIMNDEMEHDNQE